MSAIEAPWNPFIRKTCAAASRISSRVIKNLPYRTVGRHRIHLPHSYVKIARMVYSRPIKVEKMKYFVTGATGFIGQEVVHQLSSAGHSVNALVREVRRAEKIK